MRRFGTLAMMFLAVVLGAGLGFMAFQPVQRWLEARQGTPAASQPVGLETVYEVMDLLQTEYIKSLDTRALLNGALKGMREKLKEAKVPAELLDLPEGDRSQLVEGFEERYYAAQTAAEGKVDKSDLTYAALGGMIVAVGDPYTNVLDPKQYRRLDEQMKGGNFGGVGIYIEADQHHSKRLTVVEPIEGSPAAEKGLETGDWITAINGETTEGMDIEAAASKIRGPIGTFVELTVKRSGKEPFSVKLERKQIHVKSATGRVLPGGIGYIRLRFFGEDTSDEFLEALRKVQGEGAKALVVDLRNNGGGYIKAALDVVSNFVKKGDLVVSVVNPRVQRNEPHKAGSSELVTLPTVILVNQFSASASEITAGALKDHRAAVLVGEKTFGKASVQSIHPLSDGGALKYTVAHYLTPNGRDIHRQGIVPDVVVEAEPSNKLGSEGDKQLDAAVEYLKKQVAASGS